MTPLQRIAMGLVLVLVDASFSGYDGVPDPVGWLLVIWGAAELRRVLDQAVGLLLLAGLSLAVSAVTYAPSVAGRLDAAGGWALSLPQLVFSVVLAAQLAGRLEQGRRVEPDEAPAAAPAKGPDDTTRAAVERADDERRLARRFGTMRWVFAVLAAAPAVVVGGGVDSLRGALAFAVAVANVYFIYLLFRASAAVPGPEHPSQT